MSWNGSGVVTPSNTFKSGAQLWTDTKNGGHKFLASDMDAFANNLAADTQACLAKNGENAATGNLNLGGYQAKSAADGTVRTDLLTVGQHQDGAVIWCGTAGGTGDAITLTPSPAVTAYTAGAVFRFLAKATNTTAVTLDISGVGTADVKHMSYAQALTGGEIVVSQLVEVLFDGTNFQLIRAPRLYPLTTLTATGSAAGDAAAVQNGSQYLTTTSTGSGQGIILPVIGTGAEIGTVISGYAGGSNDITAYPGTGQTILGAGSQTLTKLKYFVLRAISSTNWILTIPVAGMSIGPY